MDDDFLFALRLQESTSLNPERPLSIVDESWEMLDPNPDIRAMFLQFNDLFFWGKLSSVEVKWSPRMTLCAGVCSYEGRGGLCSIRLSEPLLKLRPRRDLVETLLHEMIHAVLFVTQNNRDRDGHGPEFCKHMNRINSASGTKITIYHSFHDEVDLYRQHWWAPSSNDTWWRSISVPVGGNLLKSKKPENYKKDETSKNVDSKRKPSAKNLPKKCPSMMIKQNNHNPLAKSQFANVSAFRNVNGSPIRVSTSGNIHFRSHRNNLVGGHHSTTTEPRNMKTVQSLEKPGTSLSTSTLSNVKKLTKATVIRFLIFFPKNKKTGDKQPSASTSQNYNLPSGDPEPKFQEGARVNCPVCRVSVLESAINVHLDSCLLLGLS
uniref:DNA-dependent metalloprotease SPRTN n=1 Tax=Erpetoichthys calabaricus TaxID=27687 RepID=A0A8C4RI46_ERPCA